MFSGSIPALATPFCDGSFAEDQFRAFVDWQIDHGSNALVPCGTTGEAATLSFEEHFEVVRVCVEQTNGRVPVIAGCGSNDTQVALKNMTKAKEVGADAALLVPPYYNKPNQDGVKQHFEYLLEGCDLPIVLYNVPSRTVTDIGVEVMGELAKYPNVVGVKDASADMDRVSAQREACGEDFCQLSGNDYLTLGFMAMGGVGCVSVTANVAPRLCAEFLASCSDGDYAKALELNDRLYRLHGALFSDASPGPVKYALSRVFDGFSDELRLPMTPPSSASRKSVDAALEIAGPGLMAKPRPVEFDKQKIVAENRRARYDYHLDDKFEAGIVLRGTEVKSLRFGSGSIAESYAEVKDDEAWLVNANIPEWSHGNRHNHEPTRPRKLLLSRRELNRLYGAVMRKGMTIVPLSIYFNGKGKAKLELALAKGKKAPDKRATEKDRDWKRQQGRLMRDYG